MPGAVTEPKSTPWKVTAKIVEERIKLKQNNSRIALALHNAKIHRPGLYLSAKTTFNRGSGFGSTQQNTTGRNQNSIKAIPTKRVNNEVNCKQELWSQTERDISKTRSQTCSSDVSGKTVSKLDSKKLRCSCQIAMDANSYNRSQNLSENSESRARHEKSDKIVALKTVNVKPWENDGIKTAKNTEPHPSIHDGDKSVKRNLSRLVSLLQECNDMKNCPSAKTQNSHRTLSCQDDDGTVQHPSQKLLKPGRIVYSHSSDSHEGQLEDNCLSGILLVSSKMPANPWSFQQLPSIHRVQKHVKTPDSPVCPVFERGPRLCEMKPVCNLCTDCRKTFQNVSTVYGPDLESENLTRLKYKLKVRERKLLKTEKIVDKPLYKVRFDSERTSSNELVRDDQSKSKLGETFTLPKLYLSHHSSATANHQKPRKMKTKMIDSTTTSETCSSVAKQCCYKLAKMMERLNSSNSPRDKLIKKSAKKSKTLQESSTTLLSQADHLRNLMTPLRGFTPHCSELPESPMLWRENTEVKGSGRKQQEKEKEKGDSKGEER
ncbi:uncharacterized protein LOC144638997 [Oculina patagonica]